MEDLDAILDAALKNYVGQAPPPGLESRIMRQVHKPRLWRFWIPAVAVLATASLMLMVRQPVPARLPLPPRQIEAAPVVASAPPMVVNTVLAPMPKRRPAKPQPTEQPIEQPTQQQIALAEFARNYPEQALAMVTHEEVTPLKVSLLSIPALKIEELKTQESTL